ncbi:MAG: hypothetical protein Q8M31_20100 [Beijerinckiaceae bacterium]|nr:hypothetical protein [Beijerinckiaceae bacterium]
MARAKSNSLVRTIAIGFIAGALGVLLFHQLAGWFIVGRMPWSNWAPVPPFAVPTILNQTFWGGMWGILFALLADRFPRGVAFLVVAFLFGAILPSAFSWYVIPLIKGGAMGPRGVWYNGPLINGAWGLGTGICYVLLRRLIR